MKKFEVAGHEPSFLPDGEWKLVWADEFDGTELDRTKWDLRLNFWGKRFDGYVFYCDGVETAHCSEHVSHVPQFVLLTTEVQGYRSSGKKKRILGPNGEEIEAATYEILDKYEDDAFIVDFVRVYDKVENDE